MYDRLFQEIPEIRDRFPDDKYTVSFDVLSHNNSSTLKICFGNMEETIIIDDDAHYEIPLERNGSLNFALELLSGSIEIDNICLYSFVQNDSTDYLEVYENDLIEANKNIVISSPSLSIDKVERIMDIVKTKQEEGLEIVIITNDPDFDLFGDSDNNVIVELVSRMKNAGMNVVLKNDTDPCFAIIDDEIIWYGGINLLGKEDLRDNLIRIIDNNIATELLEKGFISKS